LKSEVQNVGKEDTTTRNDTHGFSEKKEKDPVKRYGRVYERKLYSRKFKTAMEASRCGRFHLYLA
jgi:hypothetical protein